MVSSQQTNLCQKMLLEMMPFSPKVYIGRRIKRFPAKTFTNVGMVQRVIKIEYVHQPTTLATKVQIQGGGPLPVWQSTTPAGHDSSPSRDFAYIAPRSTFSGFKKAARRQDQRLIVPSLFTFMSSVYSRQWLRRSCWMEHGH